MDDFKTATLVPSSAHGSATPQNFAKAVDEEMGQFVQNKDVDKTATNLQRRADEFLKAT
jgi:glucose/mannose transport system substrate-binding protein